MSEAPRQVSPIEDIRATLEKMGGQFKAVMPTQEHVDRFIRVVMTAVQQSPALIEANRMSFYASCMKCAQDGLMPDGKEAVLNVYNTKVGDKYEKMVQYQPMVEGMMKKLRNSGEVVGAPKVHVVKERDEFTYELGDAERIVHKPALSARGKVVAAYSIVRLKSGDTSREVMSVEDIEDIRKRSKTPDSGPWKTDYDEMCRKTVFRRHSKRLPKSTDLDNVLKNDDDTFTPYADRQPEPQQQAAQRPAAAAGATGRPKALEHVVSQQPPAVKVDAEKAPIEGEAKRETGAAVTGGVPTDVI